MPIAVAIAPYDSVAAALLLCPRHPPRTTTMRGEELHVAIPVPLREVHLFTCRILDEGELNFTHLLSFEGAIGALTLLQPYLQWVCTY
jgi:hypothetical protein